MKFGTVPIADAQGAILAHGVSLTKNAFKKGRVLTKADIATLAAANVVEIIVARLEPGDIAEDDAAARIAAILQGPGVTLGTAATGRANLYAAAKGLVVIDEARIDEINAVDEGVTAATLRSFDPVEPRAMLATIKIIPFGVKASVVARIEAMARIAPPAITVRPFQRKRAVLISTATQGMRAVLIAKNADVTHARLTAIGSVLEQSLICEHRAERIAATIKAALAQHPDLILIFSASAIVDRRDVVPMGLQEAEGAIVRFGMPVDPGNLILLGELQGIPVIGLPGCARSPKRNGFDWVLERICADMTVDAAQIQAMGVGGLLKEIPSRPHPRERKDSTASTNTPNIAAIVLAAGQSSRMGGTNKLLAKIGAEPVIRYTCRRAIAAGVSPVVVVTGRDANELSASLTGLGCELSHNSEFASGMASSIRTGIRNLPADCDAVLICLGDMPAVKTATLKALAVAFDPLEGKSIVAPVFRGKRGNPALFDKALFPELIKLEGDQGARRLIEANADLVCEVPVEDEGVILDADTPEALLRMERLMARDESGE